MKRKTCSKRDGRSKTKLYRIWVDMYRRCYMPHSEGFKWYGAKGIRVLWDSFDEFKRDMGRSYTLHVAKHGEKDTTIDRIKNDGHYEKSNCRWATRFEQMQNRTNTISIVLNGERMSVSAASKKLGMDRNAILQRIRRGWTGEDLLLPKDYRSLGTRKRLIKYRGKSLTIPQWSKETGITEAAIRWRLKVGHPLNVVFLKQGLIHRPDLTHGGRDEKGRFSTRVL